MNGHEPSVVLIVDDNPASRETLGALLAEDGYQIHYAANGPDALEIASRIWPDVVLLDQVMPGMSGVEVCECIRALPELAEMPIVFVTALDDRATRLEAFQAGADDVVTKPVDRVEVRMRVRNITRLNRYRSLLQGREDVGRMLEELERAYDATIKGWARALEYRDSETKGHCDRVSKWAVELAIRLGFEHEDLQDVWRGALLHDIGKMGVHDAILLKEGPLDPAERREMERHTEIAHQLLSPIGYLSKSLVIPHLHHERWDGKGYPLGLKGTEIPLIARLFSVIDVYDALTSDRPYRKAWSREKALGYLQENAGSQFDPACVQAFLDLLQDAPAVFNSGELAAEAAMELS